MRFILVITAVILASCGVRSGDRIQVDLRRGLDTITTQELTDNLTYLASSEFEGRRTGTIGETKAADYLSKKLEEYGFLPGGDNGGWTQKFSSGKNVVGIINGSDLKDEFVVIGAHYDHMGRGYPGADDNGSGTVAVIEVAEALSRVAEMQRRTIVVVFFSGEEQGLVGSYAYVKKPNFPISKLVYMINLDMVGYLRNGKLSFLGGGASTYVKSLIQNIVVSYPEIKPDITSNAGGGSDHVPFIRAGVGSTFLHTGLTDVYHTGADTADKINYVGLTSVSKIAFELLFRLAFDEQKPKGVSAVSEIFIDHQVPQE